MANVLPIEQLIAEMTEDDIMSFLITVAGQLGFTYTSWPKFGIGRTVFRIFSKIISPWSKVIVKLASAGFLELAAALPEIDWLKLLAFYQYGVVAQEADVSTVTETLTSTTGVAIPFVAGELIFAHSGNGRTYRNTVAGTIPSSGTYAVTIQGVDPGTESNAAPGEISILVNGIAKVTCTNATAYVGVEAETPQQIVDRCRSRLGALSPNGPAQAYRYVALTRTLNGGVAVTRVLLKPESTTGVGRAWIAGADGALSAPEVALVLIGLLTWATPLCFTPQLASAINRNVAVTYQAYILSTENLTVDEVKALVAARLETYFATMPIEGFAITPGSGKVWVNALEGEIKRAAPVFQVSVTLPAADLLLAEGEVAVLDTLSGTVTVVSA